MLDGGGNEMLSSSPCDRPPHVLGYSTAQWAPKATMAHPEKLSVPALSAAQSPFLQDNENRSDPVCPRSNELSIPHLDMQGIRNCDLTLALGT